MRVKLSRVIQAANSGVEALVCQPSQYFHVLIGNEVADRMRWVCLAPYGDWPNRAGLQKFRREDANEMVREFNSVINTPQRLLGLPWYVGHPDHPAFNEKHRDYKAYGRIKRLEAREDGLWAGVRFGSDGERLIADEAFDGHSVNWFLKQDGHDKKAWRPFRLKSVGFTNQPNIPVAPVTTANEEADLLKGRDLRWTHMAKLRLFGYQMANEDANPKKDIISEGESDRPLGEARQAMAAKGQVPTAYGQGTEGLEVRKNPAAMNCNDRWRKMANMRLAKNEGPGHPFRGNQWTEATDAGMSETHLKGAEAFPKDSPSRKAHEASSKAWTTGTEEDHTIAAKAHDDAAGYQARTKNSDTERKAHLHYAGQHRQYFGEGKQAMEKLSKMTALNAEKRGG